MRAQLLIILCLLAACSAAPAHTPTAAPTEQPTPTEIPRALIEEAAAFCPQPRNWTIYVTQPGDTLRSLAERTSSTVDELALANCLQNPGALGSGQVVYLPRKPITP